MKAKRILSGLISAVVAISATVSLISFTVNAEETFDDLNQEEITAAMGASWNLGNQFDAYANGKGDETSWGNPTVKKELIQAVKNAGFKSIRIPVTYMGRIGPQTTYKIDEAWLDRIQEVVDWCIECDLYVIINIHHDGNQDSDNGAWLDCSAPNQNAIVAKFEACWRQIAEKFADYDEHLIFESMNEVGASGNPTQAVYDNINNYNQVFVDTVRQTSDNNAKRWLLVPGWYTNIDNTVGDYGFAIPTDTHRDSSIPESEKRIMVSVHYYDPWDFGGDDTSGSYSQWGEDGNPSKKVTWNSDEDYMEGQIKKVYNKFVTTGYPVIIGEYGCINKTDSDAVNTIYRAHYDGTMCKLCKEYGCVPVYWDNGAVGNSFGLINRNTYKIEQPEIIDAMMEVYLSPKENLSRYITFISELKSDNYTTETWSAVNTALETAQGLVAAEGTSDEDLTKAYTDLKTAYYKLMEDENATAEYVSVREGEKGNSIELIEEAIALGQTPEGYIVSLEESMLAVKTIKELTFKFKITSEKKPAADDNVFNIKPYDTNVWSGWNDNFVKLSDCTYDESADEYTYTVDAKKILDSYKGGNASGANAINLYYGNIVVDENGNAGNALNEKGEAIFDKDGVAIQLTYYSATYPITHTRHHYEEGSYTFTEPTCTEQGYREYKCTACGEVYQDMYKAKGHTWSAWETVKEATCGEAGMRKHTCSIDNVTEEQEIPATGKHNFVNGVCTVCGAKDTIEEPHEPDKPGNNNNNNNNGNQTAKPGTTAPANNVTTTAPKSNAKADAQKIVNKAKIKNLKASAKGKKVTIKWKKASKVTGYIIQVSAKKNFKKPLAKKTLKKNSKKVTLKIKKLKKGKTYWVRVRAYKNYKANGKTEKATGSWKKIKFKVNISTKSKE